MGTDSKDKPMTPTRKTAQTERPAPKPVKLFDDWASI